ncbi:MAG: undecaprenyldiphospho-muramoylpentapeptide beta-N-acetylglucosaminyltransferase [Chlorobi bacterium]|nr:undecaprenyldiphospho-muramoylpentapeptide beta-N-acetylglucosaminyltransferase [Chlorobiota bacterium]
MKNKKGRFLFVAGATGGHLFPALAVADRCRELLSEASIRFVGAKGRLEEEVVPRSGYELDLLWISGFDRTISLRNAVLPIKILRSLAQSRKIIKRFRPDVVVCAGAYVSWPVGSVAVSRGLPLILMESNALPGMVVRKLAPKAKEVHVAFEETKKWLPGPNVLVSGNPIRRVFHKQLDKGEARRHFGLDPDRPTLFVFGGSLGARSINNALDGLLGSLLSDGLQVIWQTGKSYKGEERRESNLYRSPFLHEMDKGYAAADLVLARAGATTIAELKAVGTPSILVPLPTATDDHQRMNAEAMQRAGASRMILDKDLAEQLHGTIIELMVRPDLLAEMDRKARSMASLDADDRIARSVLGVVECS